MKVVKMKVSGNLIKIVSYELWDQWPTRMKYYLVLVTFTPFGVPLGSQNLLFRQGPTGPTLSPIGLQNDPLGVNFPPRCSFCIHSGAPGVEPPGGAPGSGLVRDAIWCAVIIVGTQLEEKQRPLGVLLPLLARDPGQSPGPQVPGGVSDRVPGPRVGPYDN